MLYPKDLRDKISEGLRNKHTPQQILCELVLWQWSDVVESMKLLKEECSVENFLSVFLKITEEELCYLVEALSEYKDTIGKDVIPQCCSHKVPRQKPKGEIEC